MQARIQFYGCTIIELFIPFLYIWDISFNTVNNTLKKSLRKSCLPHPQLFCQIKFLEMEFVGPHTSVLWRYCQKAFLCGHTNSQLHCTRLSNSHTLNFPSMTFTFLTSQKNPNQPTNQPTTQTNKQTDKILVLLSFDHRNKKHLFSSPPPTQDFLA